MSTPLEQWVESVARMTRPAQIQWCDGSEAEAARIDDQLVREGQTFPLNEKSYPHCFLHRSAPSDVARTVFAVLDWCDLLPPPPAAADSHLTHASVIKGMSDGDAAVRL